MAMRRLGRSGPLLVILSVLALVAVARLRDGGPERVAWAADLPTAQRLAAANGRGVVLDFSAAWCGPCQEMHRTVWTDASLARTLADHWQPVRVDIDAQPAIAGRYGIRAVPTLVVTDAAGHELRRSEGFMSADEVRDWLGAATAR